MHLVAVERLELVVRRGRRRHRAAGEQVAQRDPAQLVHRRDDAIDRQQAPRRADQVVPALHRPRRQRAREVLEPGQAPRWRQARDVVEQRFQRHAVWRQRLPQLPIERAVGHRHECQAAGGARVGAVERVQALRAFALAGVAARDGRGTHVNQVDGQRQGLR